MPSFAEGPLWQESFHGKPLHEFTKHQALQVFTNEFARPQPRTVESERALRALADLGLQVPLLQTQIEYGE
jgi:hypothetical protein